MSGKAICRDGHHGAKMLHSDRRWRCCVCGEILAESEERLSWWTLLRSDLKETTMMGRSSRSESNAG